MTHRYVSLILVFAFTLCSCSRSTHTSADSNKALFRHAVDVWAAGDVSALEQVVAPGYIGHPQQVTATSKDYVSAAKRSTSFIVACRFTSRIRWLMAIKSSRI